MSEGNLWNDFSSDSTEKFLANYFEKFPALFSQTPLWSSGGLWWSGSSQKTREIFSQLTFHNPFLYFTKKINSVHTMFVKIGDFVKFKGFLVEFLENRRSWENQKPPENRQKSGLFWASPFTMHLVWTLLKNCWELFWWKVLCGFHNSFHRKMVGEWIVKSKGSQRYCQYLSGKGSEWHEGNCQDTIGHYQDSNRTLSGHC